MASGPITSWKIDGEMVADFILGGSKITTDGDCSHEIKRRFLVLEKILESPLDCKEIQPVQPKGDQSWVFFGRTDVEAETPILWLPDVKSWLIGKDPDAGKDWRQEERRTTEYEMVGWHHWLDGYGFGWTPGVGDGQGCLACCSSWGRKELDTTECLNWLTPLYIASDLCWILSLTEDKKWLTIL